MFPDIKIICLTLKSSPDRYNEAKQHFNDLNLDVQFFNGIDGSTLNIEDFHVFETIDVNKSTWRVRNGVVGCWLSHLLIWNMLLRKDWEFVLILEDDVTLSLDFKERFMSVYKELPADWDLFYLGGGKIPQKRISPNLVEGVPTGTYAYMVKKSILKQLILLSSNRITDIDITMLESIPTREIKSYIASPVLATEKSVNGGNMPQEGVWKSLTFDWIK